MEVSHYAVFSTIDPVFNILTQFNQSASSDYNLKQHLKFNSKVVRSDAKSLTVFVTRIIESQ